MSPPMNGPTTPIVEVQAGTWVIAVQVSQNNGATITHSMTLCRRDNCTEAEAIKEALEATQNLKPGFSIDQWLTTFIPAATSTAPLQVPSPISNERGGE